MKPLRTWEADDWLAVVTLVGCCVWFVATAMGAI